MSLLNKLIKQGSTLSNLNGQTPSLVYTEGKPIKTFLAGSQLDLDGLTPSKYESGKPVEVFLAGSQLDLNGLTPPKYLDNLPQ